MNATTLFRGGAIVLALQATGHLVGGVLLYHAHSPAEADAIAAMQASRIPVMGVTRSLWDFYYGSGLAIGALAYVLAGVAWAAGQMAKQPDPQTGFLTLLLAAGCLSQVLICLRYFFALPAGLNLLGALLCGAAWFVQHRAARPVPVAA